MAKILFTGAFRFPDQDAAALRINSMVELLSPYYEEIVVCGWEQAPKNLIDSECYIFNGIKCFPQAELDNKYKSITKKLSSFLLKGEPTLYWIKNYIKNNNIDVIVVYNPPALFSLKLIRLCEENNIKLVLDSTEWYESDHLPMGKFGIPSIENYLRMNYVYPKIKNIISISHYLNNHYRYKNGKNELNQIILPIIANSQSTNIKPPISQQINFIYAGNPGKKDNIIDFINYLPLLRQEINCPILLNVAGISPSQLKDLLGSDKYVKVKSYIKCHGRLSKSDVAELYKISHFSILFRDDKRYAYAGFPTKLVESWCNLTPVICNPIGDITLYAHHGENACIINNLSQISIFMNDLRENNSYDYMQQQCKITIDLNLSNDVYAQKLIYFFSKLK